MKKLLCLLALTLVVPSVVADDDGSNSKEKSKRQNITMFATSDGFDVPGFINIDELVFMYPTVRHVSLTFFGNVDVPDDHVELSVQVSDDMTPRILLDIDFYGPRVKSVEFDALSWRLIGLNAGGNDLKVRFSYTETYPSR